MIERSDIERVAREVGEAAMAEQVVHKVFAWPREECPDWNAGNKTEP